MGDRISLDVTEQEALLLAIRSLTESATDLTQKLNTVVESLPSLSSSGEFSSRVVSGDLLGRFVSKAQTFQTLTEVLFKHTQTTYTAFIDTDKLLAADIANSLLNDPSADAETKDYIKNNQAEALTNLQTSIAEGGMSESLNGAKSEDLIMVTGTQG